MLAIKYKVWSHRSDETEQRYSVGEVLTSEPAEIGTFPALVRSIANLSYQNPHQALFFRGQSTDFSKSGAGGKQASSFYPRIYRSPGRSLPDSELEDRFGVLERRASKLLEHFKKRGIHGHERLNKFPELIWAILQHYEVCDTPLLDVTHSLRVAASFSLRAARFEGYLYVFELPHPNGSITYSVEHELMNVRLLSICPPEAQRPYFQEGFLVGTFPLQKRFRKRPSLDVGVRLIGKFKLIAQGFWDDDFRAIPDAALFPEDDAMSEFCKSLKNDHS
jgi:hypothetical protein